ncbi:cytochrome P450 [Streptomyces sp. MAR4 CNX-425]|uniref:cytochrome P450 n=1 Tax=Streptomyces sp. MAR4 CNX-425 TaxID=3406343 RepID=UPI003B505A43
MNITEAGRTLADPSAYADDDRLYRALSLLRRESPVHWVDAPGYNPFWAVTRHADIQEVERRSDVFLNGPRPMLVTRGADEMNRLREQRNLGLRPLVHLDGQAHRTLRSVTADFFRPPALSRFDVTVRTCAERAVDRMAEHGDSCEFVGQVSDVYALRVLLALLGIPEREHEAVFRFTPAARRSLPPPARKAAMDDFYRYFSRLAAHRRTSPADDLASVIANAHVAGRELTRRETLAYYIIIVAAGHDTASATIAGGLRALIDHPAQLHLLREDPGLLDPAVEEMTRWVTPVKAFMRTAAEDYVLRDVRIRKGESLLLSYPSANRDAAVFERPGEFDIRRRPNRHLAFGFGVHHCLGAALARMEIRAFFAELLPRLVSVEPAGPPELISTTFSGGPKRLPLRCSVGPSRNPGSNGKDSREPRG